MTSFLFLTALFCYVAISIYFVRSLFAMANQLLQMPNQQPCAMIHRIHRPASLTCLSVGLLCHLLILYPNLITQTGYINLNLANICSLTSLLMLGFSIVFTSYRPIIVLNVLAAPLAAIGLIIGYINPTTTIFVATKLSSNMQIHIVLSMASYSVLSMASLQAILLRLQSRELKHQTKNRIWVRLLPALQTMEKLLFDMIIFGFVLLTVALVFGWIGSKELLTHSFAYKTVFGLLAWILFAWLIFGHWRFGWRGKLAANMTLGGVCILAVGFLGTKFIMSIILA